MTHKLIKTDNYLFVLEHSKIKRGDTVKYDNGYFEATHDNYHDSLMKIIAHLPLNNAPILEGIDLLPPYDSIDYLAETFANNVGGNEAESKAIYFGYKTGYEKAREKFEYTKDDMMKAIEMALTPVDYEKYLTIDEIIQSLSQYPTEFECEMFNQDDLKSLEEDFGKINKPKTTTNAQGQRVWVGKYL